MKITAAVIVTLTGTLGLEPILRHDKNHLHSHNEMQSPMNVPTGVKVYGNIQFNNQPTRETVCVRVTLMEY